MLFRSTTAEVLTGFGIQADLLPKKFTGDGLADALIELGVNGKKILLPRAVKARESLPERLTAGGAQVTVAPVYQNVRPEDKSGELRELLGEGLVDMVTFTSSSTVTNFLHMLGAENSGHVRSLLDGIAIASIGPITTGTIVEAGLQAQVQPDVFTIPALIDSIVAYYSNPN